MHNHSFAGRQPRGPVTHSCRYLGLFATDNLIPKRLIVVFELLKLLQALIEIYSEMSDDVAYIIRMRRVVLHNDAHDPADELNVGSQSSERAKNGGHTELRVIEALSENLN